MSTHQEPTVDWKSVPTRTITAGGVDVAYRELGTNDPGTPVVFLVHLFAVLDNWDPRVVDGFAATRRVITFDNRGVGASSGSPATSIEQMATDAIISTRIQQFGGCLVHERSATFSGAPMACAGTLDTPSISPRTRTISGTLRPKSKSLATCTLAYTEDIHAR